MTSYTSICHCTQPSVCVWVGGCACVCVHMLIVSFEAFNFSSFGLTNVKLDLFLTTKSTHSTVWLNLFTSLSLSSGQRVIPAGEQASYRRLNSWPGEWLRYASLDCLSPGKQSFLRLCNDSFIQIWCFSLHDDLKCHLVTKMDLENLEKRYKVRSGSVSQQSGHSSI